LRDQPGQARKLPGNDRPIPRCGSLAKAEKKRPAPARALAALTQRSNDQQDGASADAVQQCVGQFHDRLIVLDDFLGFFDRDDDFFHDCLR
jgi:hypothetical protein